MLDIIEKTTMLSNILSGCCFVKVSDPYLLYSQS